MIAAEVPKSLSASLWEYMPRMRPDTCLTTAALLLSHKPVHRRTPLQGREHECDTTSEPVLVVAHVALSPGGRALSPHSQHGCMLACCSQHGCMLVHVAGCIRLPVAVYPPCVA